MSKELRNLNIECLNEEQRKIYTYQENDNYFKMFDDKLL